MSAALVGQAVLSGILGGALYAVVALGFGLVLGVLRVLNLAHGALVMLGAYAAWWLGATMGLSPWASLLVSLPVLFALGVALQDLALRRLEAAPPVAALLLTFGLSLALVGLARQAFTADPHALAATPATLRLGPLAASGPRLGGLALAAVLVAAAGWALRRTRLGAAVRAVTQSPELARACGIDVGRVQRLAAGAAGALAAVAGVLVAATATVHPEMAEAHTLRSLAVVVLGGVGSVPGVLAGGLLLGLGEQLAALLLGAALGEAATPLLVLAVLLARPHGLLGERGG